MILNLHRTYEALNAVLLCGNGVDCEDSVYGQIKPD